MDQNYARFLIQKEKPTKLLNFDSYSLLVFSQKKKRINFLTKKGAPAFPQT